MTAIPALAKPATMRLAASGVVALSAQQWLAVTRPCMPWASVRSMMASNSRCPLSRCSSICMSSGRPLRSANSNSRSRNASGSSAYCGTPPTISAPSAIAALSQLRAASSFRGASLVKWATTCKVRRSRQRLSQLDQEPRCPECRFQFRYWCGCGSRRCRARGRYRACVRRAPRCLPALIARPARGSRQRRPATSRSDSRRDAASAIYRDADGRRRGPVQQAAHSDRRPLPRRR